MSIRDNMKKISQYNEIVKQAYKDDPRHIDNLSRDIKLHIIDLHNKLNEKLYAELRKDLMTLGVGCISLFEGIILYKDPSDMTDEELDRLDEWKTIREDIFDRINLAITKYQNLLLEEKHERQG